MSEQSLPKDLGSPGCADREECNAGRHKNPQPSSFPHTLPPRFVNVEDFFLGKGLSDFLTTGFNCLGDLLVKIAYRSKGDVDSEKGLGNILTAPSCHPVQGRKIRQHSGKSRAKTGSGVGGNVCTRFVLTKPMVQDAFNVRLSDISSDSEFGGNEGRPYRTANVKRVHGSTAARAGEISFDGGVQGRVR